jgi:hypothetical protein
MVSKEDFFECIESMSQEERQRFAILLGPILRELWRVKGPPTALGFQTNRTHAAESLEMQSTNPR